MHGGVHRAEALWVRSQAGDAQADAELASLLVALLHEPVEVNGFSPAWHDVITPSTTSPLRVGHLPQQAVSTVQVRASHTSKHQNIRIFVTRWSVSPDFRLKKGSGIHAADGLGLWLRLGLGQGWGWD